MWKRLSVFCVILVLVLGSLAAWPTWLTGKPAETETLHIQSSPAQNTVENQETIKSLKLSVKQLESQLSEYQKQQETLNSNLEKSGAKLNDTAATAASLLNEIDNLKTLLEISETSRISSENEYALLKADHDLKVKEADRYFQEGSKAVAKYNALAEQKKENLWSTTVGAAAVMKGGEYGVDATVGVGYGPITIFGGATYMLGDGPFSFKMDDLAYKAGLTFTF